MDDSLGFADQEQLPPSVSAASLELSGLTRRFGDQVAADGVSLSVNAGELVALIGASGSGKTTTLRMTAGYEPPDAGRVLLDGRDITDLPAQKRGFGMVFQHYALFPHLSVQDNVAFGLEARGWSRGDRRARALSALQQVGLAHTAERPVQALSGGEQQRVALARAVVIEPRVLLLDEPLSNLDPILRRGMRDELRSMLRDLQVTALFVTHDQEDAFAVADRVALMKKGKLLQVGRPEDLYQSPVNRDVAEFIGKSVLLPAEVSADTVTVKVGGRAISAQRARSEAVGSSSSRWLAVLRPESVQIERGNSESRDGWTGKVIMRRFAGATFVYHIRVDGDIDIEAASPALVAEEGEPVLVTLARRPIAAVPAS